MSEAGSGRPWPHALGVRMAKVQRLTHADILSELERFEREYGETSAAFHERFVNGKAGDSAEAMEWAWLYDVAVELGIVVKREVSTSPTHA